MRKRNRDFSKFSFVPCKQPKSSIFNSIIFKHNNNLAKLATKFYFSRSCSVFLPYGHTQNTVVMYWLVLLVASWNCQICYKNAYARLLVLPLLPVLNPWLIVEMQPAYFFSVGNYFGRCSSELAQLLPLPSCRWKSTCYSDKLHDFSVTISACYKNVYFKSFFLHIARLLDQTLEFSAKGMLSFEL